MNLPREERTYDHAFHAGNVGDVWKHAVLIATLRDLKLRHEYIHYIDIHAGLGMYSLGPTGEWTEGIGKLRDVRGPQVLTTLASLQVARQYLGSPLVARRTLRSTDSLTLMEQDPKIHDALARNTKPWAQALAGDGWQILAGIERGTGHPVVLVDPSYTTKEEWRSTPANLIEAWKRWSDATFLLWYPIKSYTRPNAMFLELGPSGMPGVALELITTPLDLQRNRLNGSGMLLVNASDELVAECLAMASYLGRAMATHGRWQARTVAWQEPWRGRTQ